MPTLTAEAVLKNPLKLFGDFKVSEKDLSHYKQLISEGKEEQAVDEFLAKYVEPHVEQYQLTLQFYLKQASLGQLSAPDKSGLEKSVALLTVGLSSLLVSNFSDFANQVIAPPVFERNRIITTAVRKSILDQTVSQFEELTKNTLLETQSNVLTYIRTLQKEMIIENQKILRQGFTEKDLSAEITRFKSSLREKFPDLFKAMENGQILKSTAKADGTTRNYKLDNFLNETVRTTILNIERNAVQVDAELSGDQVVEYRQLDMRTVKQPREICIHILSRRVNGKALLAIDQETASRLGILTIADAMSQGAMGNYCRHGILRVSEEFSKKVGE